MIIKTIEESLFVNDKIMLQGGRQCYMTTLLYDFCIKYATINTNSKILICNGLQNFYLLNSFKSHINTNRPYMNNVIKQPNSVVFDNGSTITLDNNKLKLDSAVSSSDNYDLIVIDNAALVDGKTLKSFCENFETNKKYGINHKLILGNTGIDNKTPNEFLSMWFADNNYLKKTVNRKIDFSESRKQDLINQISQEVFDAEYNSFFTLSDSK